MKNMGDIEKDYDLAKKINVEATRNICKAAKNVGATVFYISTDYVFDGDEPPFKEPFP